MQQVKTILVCAAILTGFAPSPVLAFFDFWDDDDGVLVSVETVHDSVSLQNDISALANTGNQKHLGGEVETGDASAEVRVVTFINGELAEDVATTSIHNAGDFGTPMDTRVQKEVEVIAERPAVRVETNVRVEATNGNGETDTPVSVEDEAAYADDIFEDEADDTFEKPLSKLEREVRRLEGRGAFGTFIRNLWHHVFSFFSF